MEERLSKREQRLASCKDLLEKREFWSGVGGRVARTRTVEGCETYMESRGRRLPTNMKSDGQALPWELQPETRKQVSHVPCKEKLLCPNQHFRLQLAVGTHPKNITDELCSQKSIKFGANDW